MYVKTGVPGAIADDLLPLPRTQRNRQELPRVPSRYFWPLRRPLCPRRTWLPLPPVPHPPSFVLLPLPRVSAKNGGLLHALSSSFVVVIVVVKVVSTQSRQLYSSYFALDRSGAGMNDPGCGRVAMQALGKNKIPTALCPFLYFVSCQDVLNPCALRLGYPPKLVRRQKNVVP